MLKESANIQSEVSSNIYSTPLKLFPDSRGQRPFLKWAGGKTQLVNDIIKLAPPKFNKYIEPFIGGGAIYFNINHPKSIISDLNEDLIITYKQVKET